MASPIAPTHWRVGHDDRAGYRRARAFAGSGRNLRCDESNSLISQDQINAAVERLAQAAQPERILVFGSHARGEAREESDFDLLVIETEVPDRAAEMVRLRRLLRRLRIPIDILVYSRAEVERWGNQPGSALFWALREGRVVYG